MEKSARNEPEKDAEEKKEDYATAWRRREKSVDAHSLASHCYSDAGDAAASKSEYAASSDEGEKQDKDKDEENKLP